MARKKSSKDAMIPNIESREEAASALGRIGEIQRRIISIKTELNEKIAALKAESGALLSPLEQEINNLVEALYVFAKTYRQELTSGKSKTIKLDTGTLSWRKTPPSVRVRNTKKAIEALKERGFGWFIKRKTTEEIDKEAILRDAELLEKLRGAGISITQKEEFIVKPSETGLEIPKKISRKV